MTSNIKEKYRPIEKTDDGVIRILDENYNNVVVTVGRISIDNSREDSATFSYEYDVVDLPKGIKLDEEFETLLGDIIVDIIETKLENDPKSLKFNEN